MLFLLGRSSWNKETLLTLIKRMTLPCFMDKTSFTCSPLFSHPDSRVFTSLVSLSWSSTYFFILNSYLSLFLPPRETKYRCYGNCSQRREREERRGEAACETSREETEAYIWPFPVCGLGGRFALLWTLCLSFLCEKLRDRRSDRQRKKRLWGRET